MDNKIRITYQTEHSNLKCLFCLCLFCLRDGYHKKFSHQERESRVGIFYKEGNSTVKWTVTQYHAKNERGASRTYPLNLTGIVPPETLSVQDWVQESL